MIFCHKNEKEITLGADSAQENRGSHAKVSWRIWLSIQTHSDSGWSQTLLNRKFRRRFSRPFNENPFP